MESKWKRKGTKKLWVDVPEELYEQLEKDAEKRNLKFSIYVRRILFRSTIVENRYEDQQTDVI